MGVLKVCALLLRVLVQRVDSTHSVGSICQCYQSIGLYKLAGPGQAAIIKGGVHETLFETSQDTVQWLSLTR